MMYSIAQYAKDHLSAGCCSGLLHSTIVAEPASCVNEAFLSLCIGAKGHLLQSAAEMQSVNHGAL